jgi:hypothetical protein
MKKTKRFASNGYVTNEDSNSGMKEAYDLNRAMGMAEVDSEPPKPAPKPEITISNEKTGVKGDKGNRIVTKEELKASGLSLRDFLNKEQGLTRRGEAAPAKTEAMPAKPPVSPKEPKPMQAQESSAPPGYYRDFSGKMQPKTATERPDLGAMIGSGVSKVGKALASAYQKPEKYMTKEEKESKMRAGSGTGAYKTGGSVSKASSRADGIAQRGKTRGKMC